MNLVRGTTPTIKYTFTSIEPSQITIAKLVIDQGTPVIEKDLTEATIGEDYLEWTLTQSETLSLTSSINAKIKLDWVLVGGTRGVGNTMLVDVTNSAVNEVLSV